MNSLPLLHYLKQNNLLHEAQQASVKLKRIFTENLNADHEDVLIITDYGEEDRMLAPVLGGAYYLAAKSLGLDTTIVSQQQKSKGDVASRHVETALDDSGFGNVVVFVGNSLGSTPDIGRSFRKFARARKHKFISCTGLASLKTGMLRQLMNTIDTDYIEIRKRASALKEVLDAGKEIQLTTPAGTDVWMKIKGNEAHANDGHFSIEGKGGNLPTGEVYLAPRKKKVEGKIVIDGSSRNTEGTSLITKPIIMTVKEGEVTEIQGGREASRLERSIAWAYEEGEYPWGVRRIGEFGLGVNPNARIIGAMIVDEKALNTAHVAIGSNHWFGGTVYSIIHLDQVMKNPTVLVDGELLDKSLYT